MKIYVRTTGQRELRQFEFLSPTYLIDKEHKPVSSFIKQLKQISEEDALFMEDDIIFCENFLEEVNHAIEKYPNQIINFFYRPMAYFIPEKIKGEKFIYNQCVFYPKGVALKIANELETILEGKEDIDTVFAKTYDQLQGKAMKNLKIDFINYRPCLVQHIGGSKSLLGNTGYGNLRTIYFKDDLKGIDYSDQDKMHQYTIEKLDELGIPRLKIKILE